MQMEQLTEVDGEVDQCHVNPLIERDGLPGCLVLICGQVSQVGGVVRLEMELYLLDLGVLLSL